MKAKLLKVLVTPTRSFNVREDIVPNVINKWHYHPEVEIIQVHKGTGTRFVGDDIKHFAPGDIVLLGSNLPHYIRYDDPYLSVTESKTPFATVIHFTENFWGEQFLSLPENAPIKVFLEKARYGVVVEKKYTDQISATIKKIRTTEGAERIIALLECLTAFSKMEKITTLSSIGYRNDFQLQENERMTAIYDFAFKNFRQKISLDDIAAEAGLVTNSFCRYFKSRTGKTFTGFLIELRVGYACKLLIENRRTIKQICYDCGFNNFTCFHKYFKANTGKTPQQYLNEYLEKE